MTDKQRMMALSLPQGLSQGFQYALHAHTNPQVIDRHPPMYSIPLTDNIQTKKVLQFVILSVTLEP